VASGAIISLEAYAAAAARRKTERFANCFPRGIAFGDLDSFIEINHHFLVVEWKLGNQDVKQGQFMALNRLAKQPRTTVMIVWTDADGNPTHGQRLGSNTPKRALTFKQLYDAFTEWAEKADAEKAAAPSIADRLEEIAEIDAIRTKAMMILVAEMRRS
jgi:hypothetical protein